MTNQIKLELDKNNLGYTRILEMILICNCNAKIVNYEDDDQFMKAKTVITCNRGPEIENALSANNYTYTYC